VAIQGATNSFEGGWMESVLETAARFLPALVTIAIALVVLGAISRGLNKRGQKYAGEGEIRKHLTLIVLTGIAIIALVLALPVAHDTQNQLLGLLGLVFSAVIALSSTTFVSNAMAGLMLRAVRNFKPGDFVRVGREFGRVTERGLFHTEIQTEDRDLTTLPNLYLVTNPVKVVHATGTIVSAHFTLGYDLDRQAVEPMLIEAAGDANLDEPFVQVLDLADFGVEYRVAGFLTDVKELLTARSRLRKRILDKLHGAGIEIATPALMDQRRLPEGRAIMPASVPTSAAPEAEPERKSEAIVFDKAERVEEFERLKEEHVQLEKEIAEAEKSLSSVSDGERTALEAQIAEQKRRLAEVIAALEAADGASD